MLNEKGYRMPMVSKTGKKTKSRYPLLAKIDKYLKSSNKKDFMKSAFNNDISRKWLNDRKEQQLIKEEENKRVKEVMKEHLQGLDVDLNNEEEEKSERFKFEFYDPDELEIAKFKNVRSLEYMDFAIVNFRITL